MDMEGKEGGREAAQGGLGEPPEDGGSAGPEAAMGMAGQPPSPSPLPWLKGHRHQSLKS